MQWSWIEGQACESNLHQLSHIRGTDPLHFFSHVFLSFESQNPIQDIVFKEKMN